MLDKVAIYKVDRIAARPPLTRRLPRRGPLSLLKGAKPTNAAIFWRLRWPSSGKSAIKMAEVTDPIPGVLWRISCFWRKIGVWSMNWSISSFNLSRSSSSHKICWLMRSWVVAGLYPDDSFRPLTFLPPGDGGSARLTTAVRLRRASW